MKYIIASLILGTALLFIVCALHIAISCGFSCNIMNPLDIPDLSTSK